MTNTPTGVTEPAPADTFALALDEVATALRDDCDPDCSLELHAWETRSVFVALLDRPLALRRLLRVADPYAADAQLRAEIAAPLSANAPAADG